MFSIFILCTLFFLFSLSKTIIVSRPAFNSIVVFFFFIRLSCIRCILFPPGERETERCYAHSFSLSVAFRCAFWPFIRTPNEFGVSFFVWGIYGLKAIGISWMFFIIWVFLCVCSCAGLFGNLNVLKYSSHSVLWCDAIFTRKWNKNENDDDEQQKNINVNFR